MKRFWLVTEGGQYAVYDSKEKTITDFVHVGNPTVDVEQTIFELYNSLERHDEEIGDIEDEHGTPVVEVLGSLDEE